MSIQRWIKARMGRLAPIAAMLSLLLGGAAVVSTVTATPAMAASCGDVLATISGVNVYSNAQGGKSWGYDNCGGTDDYINGVDAGGEWQCVEFVNRFYLMKGWISAHWKGNGNSLKDNLPTKKFTYQANARCATRRAREPG
jgi:hypothetical protein